MGLDLLAHRLEPARVTAEPATALSVAEDLRAWLGVTYDDLAAITGIGKTTFHHWKRTGAEPRPSTTYRLRSVHALVRALIAKLGVTGATEWLRVGTPAPIDLLLQGNYARVESLAHDVLFNQAALPERNFSAFAPYDPEVDFEVRSPAVTGNDAQPLRPRRIRLTRP
jgi:hypothetical protein